MTALNPFPDYAVMRLNVAEKADTVTIVTPPILKGRELVQNYVRRIGAPLAAGQTNAALCAVRGDYGTGKTHLLNDVAHELQVACADKPPTILRATCIESDPLTWFRTKVGPQFDSLPIQDVALIIYGNAGKITANATKLTAAAAQVLSEDPTRIRELVRKNQLSIDEVRREFEGELNDICKDYDAIVRRVLSKLVWGETESAARKWLTGATLLAREAELLGVPPVIDSPDQASAVIGAIAAMHRAAGRAFLFLIDELEHFARFDTTNRSTANITWLKRLLEELGSAGTLALVAGHWSAWETTKDYLDRFPQHSPIDLLKLDAPQIAAIVSQRAGRMPEGFGDGEAQLVADLTAGNMRRVMSLCNLLFRMTDGFTTGLSTTLIHEAWSTVTQRIPEEHALELVAELLQELGYIAVADRMIAAIKFDLVARRADGRAFVVQMRRSKTQSEHLDAAHQFIRKLDHLAQTTPNAVGIFLADGSVDDDLVKILKEAKLANVYWFDLTQRDPAAHIRKEIAAIDRSAEVASRPAAHSSKTKLFSQHTADPDDEAALFKAQSFVELERKFRELDEKRQQENDELKARLERLTAQSPRGEAISKEADVNPERARATYEAMLAPPTAHKQIRYLGGALFLSVALVGIGALLLIAIQSISGMFAYDSDSLRISFGSTAFAGVTFILMGTWLIWRRYSRVADYLEFSRNTLNDLYLRDVPVSVLSRVNVILRKAIDQGDVVYARGYAVEQLCNMKNLPPSVQEYFSDLAD